MALHGVFANDLQFVKGVDSDQAQDDERENANVDDADLEEGEIASDDDDEEIQHGNQKQEEKTGVKPTVLQGDTAKQDLKTQTGNQPEKPDSLNIRGAAVNAEKRRDKRVTSNSNNSRTRKRTGDDDLTSHRDSNRKRRRTQDGDNEDLDDIDYDINARGHSPMERIQRYGGGESAGSDYDESNFSSIRRQRGGESRARSGRSPPRRRPASGSARDRGGGDRRRQDRDRSDRDRRPAKNNPSPNTPSNKSKEEPICAFYMEGKCSRGNDCPYSHAALPPRKMELCKFYLMDCCAKKEKCLYLHKDFPCKFFHTGKKCRHNSEECKFSHEPLTETMRAILIKHIETAPREILGDFPRLSREETIQAIDHFSPVPNGREKRPHIPALFDQAGSTSSGNLTNKTEMVKDGGRHHQTQLTDRNDEPARRVAFYQESSTSETDHARVEQPEENSRSIWFGQLRQEKTNEPSHSHDSVDEPPKQKVEEEHPTIRSPLVGTKEEEEGNVDYLSTLPARQRELYRRIQQQQREPATTQEGLDAGNEQNSANDKWYSSDEEETGESITNLLRTIKQKPDAHGGKDSSVPALTNLNLTSLENINVAEIAKALSTLQQSQSASGEYGCSSSVAENSRRDPRTRDPRMRNNNSSQMSTGSVGMGDVDLRVPTPSRQDVDLRLDNRKATDVDLRTGLAPHSNLDDIRSSDVDLRRLPLPFKSAPVQVPVREIEASINLRPPMEYQVWLVDPNPPDYSAIRVHANWAHLDPRQQKGSVTARDFTVTDPPAIPLGPASPDPIPVASTLRHFEPEQAVYSPLRAAPNDPRARDPRRVTGLQAQQPLLLGEKRGISGGVGLLGAAPPGMLPLLPKGSQMELSPQDTPCVNFRSPPVNPPYIDRNVSDDPARDQHSRQMENRRDPRQRDPRQHKNSPAICDASERSYTPPPNDRVFL
ncbi:zinc finger CCCH domain-containing protein 4 isoform X2 [Daphnia magna]|uniref:zinc finger CCCH domain-containing protein 4 isoform X2 n=1 Tax=Daphnia magna TaxID=35525 RepID=UPI001E1BD8E4|nr:zinc finger CCCH domain-containing protein 4 isoform X2 [Daphnia magna]